MSKNAPQRILDAVARLGITSPDGCADVKATQDGTVHLQQCRYGQTAGLPYTTTDPMTLDELAALKGPLRRCSCLSARYGIKVLVDAVGGADWISEVLEAEATLRDIERLAERSVAPVTRLRRARLSCAGELTELYEHLRPRHSDNPAACAAIDRLISRYDDVIPTLERAHDPAAVAELERNVRADAKVSPENAADTTRLLVRVTGPRAAGSLPAAAIEAWMITGDEHQAVATVPMWAVPWLSVKCAGSGLLCQFASLDGISAAVMHDAANLAIGDSFGELADAVEAAVLLDDRTP